MKTNPNDPRYSLLVQANRLRDALYAAATKRHDDVHLQTAATKSTQVAQHLLDSIAVDFTDKLASLTELHEI